MKRVLYLIFLMVCFSRAIGQSAGELGYLYQQHKYFEALDMARKLKDTDSSAAFAYSTIGRIYVDQGHYDSSIPYLQTAIKLDHERTYISGWSYAYLGEAHLIIGERDKGISELDKAVLLKATKNSVKYAQNMLDSLRYESLKEGNIPKSYVSLEPHWVRMEGPHIIYYFQDTIGKTETVNRFITEHENAYIKISAIFRANITQKLIFYVWNDPDLAKRILHRELGFTDPEKLITNTLISQTVGHEMTHTLSYWGWGRKPVHLSRFINEGVAVAFDQNLNDKYEAARNAAADKNVHSILNIWEGENIDPRVLYPLGGAFITYIFDLSTPAQFESFIKDQTVDNARNVFGKEQFAKIIDDFNRKIGL